MSGLISEDERRKRYQPDPPADKAKLAKAWKLLEEYSGIPPDQIEAHVRAVVSASQGRNS